MVSRPRRRLWRVRIYLYVGGECCSQLGARIGRMYCSCSISCVLMRMEYLFISMYIGPVDLQRFRTVMDVVHEGARGLISCYLFSFFLCPHLISSSIILSSFLASLLGSCDACWVFFFHLAPFSSGKLLLTYRGLFYLVLIV